MEIPWSGWNKSATNNTKPFEKHPRLTIQKRKLGKSRLEASVLDWDA